jgi:hypothetical protein
MMVCGMCNKAAYRAATNIAAQVGNISHDLNGNTIRYGI